jgi:N6-adenosine-specific RNA methylase IME4
VTFLLPPDLRSVVPGPVGTIIADPPWRYDNVAAQGAAEDHYPTMSIWEIASLPVKEITDRSAHLYLWVTDSHLEDVFRLGLLEAWGFRYIQTLKWLKIKDGKPQMGVGNYYRHATELCIFAVKGRAPVAHHDTLDFFWAPRERHSAKPPTIHEYAERLSSGPYLEMFARTPRPGWYAWGNQAPAPAAAAPGLVAHPGT